MKREIIEILKDNQSKFISGQIISEKLSISRAAVWKYINQIKEEGYVVESVSRRGYKLVFVPDVPTYEEIKDNLHTKYIGRKLLYFKTIDSTNIKAKELASLGESEGTVIISEEQSMGRGRLGREWASPKYKGIWMSLILKPDIEPYYASKITLVAAAATAKTLINMGLKIKIKWPNDLVINKKKVCGILTEMSGELNKVNYIIVGIGMNVNIDEEEFPNELRNTATSLKSEFLKTFSRKEIVAEIFNNFEVLYEEFKNEGNIKSSIDICRENSVLLGEEVKIISQNVVKKAKALDINNDGELVVQYDDGKIGNIVSGEVSMRGLYGYV